MLIGIDSGLNHCYTAMVSGGEYRMFELYSEIEKLMKAEGINPPFRWTSIKKTRREPIKNKLIEILNNSKINFTLIVHKNKYGLQMRELIYESIPMVIAQSFKKSIDDSGKVVFEVDNDFNTRDTKTSYFIRKIFTQIIPMFTGQIITIREKSGTNMATFKKSSGNVLMLVGRVCDSKICKSIQIADLLIGCFRQGAKFNYRRAFIKKLC